MPRFGLILVAFRFLSGAPGARRGQGRLIGAVLAVAISLVPLVVVQHVADGMIRGIVERFIETGSYHIQALPQKELSEDEWHRFSRQVRELPGVQSTLIEHQGFGLIYSDEGRSGVTLRAVPQAFWDDDPGVRAFLEVQAGSFDLKQDQGIVLGVDVANRLGVSPGEEVRLLTVRPLGEGRMLPRVSRFLVTGVVSTGYRDLDRLWVFIDADRGRRVIPPESVNTILGIKVDHPFALNNPLFQRGPEGLLAGSERTEMKATWEALRELLGNQWATYTWYWLEEGRYISFLTSRNLLAFVMALIVAVAAVNISSALILLVVEKEEDIAILRATGMSARQTGGIFLLCGGVIGFGGAVLGVLLGTVLSLHLNEVLQAFENMAGFFAGREVDLFSADFYLEQIPVELSFPALFFSIFLALLFALCAAVLPARRAASLLPDRVLRNHG
ncbi:lipoprotein-releasing system permease protein [Alkalispirochaeta americana]|uniref:Lipoprotein-releasing system permease protein n=1 Tax=Alkalispirochaeta americana TaxID=159291 RepID=A0A1N6VQW2_9SPIO|nr:FtsX-like permease family protein [Alkalispirochaeta americana]SIQ80158.1 lipoprotein-releasing system permease protein [Alkalispirochaeta americana]